MKNLESCGDLIYLEIRTGLHIFWGETDAFEKLFDSIVIGSILKYHLIYLKIIGKFKILADLSKCILKQF